ncbi:GNAT family N-acetyltransferase [Spiroplasma endosymbiont of Danaus chrysippus]|uniref:GNAT family N-acetyltransferase n=1 Tax=Spiroplasma endosymbiont of Danaus chrysippus TaxID=2691041 RepID=UPI00157ACB5E|nr:GNAT family N-acetyltransferase [Spiroplasma endosymbiont of Danaus chrysippus]
MANGREIIITNNLNNPSIKSLLLIDEFNNKIGDAILIIDLEKKEAILESIFIEEKYRKQQYGSLLIYKIFEICHSNNIENLILLSDPTNVTVGEFYEKLGFTYAWNKKTFFMIMKLIYLMQFLIKEMKLKSEKILK